MKKIITIMLLSFSYHNLIFTSPTIAQRWEQERQKELARDNSWKREMQKHSPEDRGRQEQQAIEKWERKIQKQWPDNDGSRIYPRNTPLRSSHQRRYQKNSQRSSRFQRASDMNNPFALGGASYGYEDPSRDEPIPG